MNCEKVAFSQHAFTRMFERRITPDRVLRAVQQGEVIAAYEDDQPYPSYLLLHMEAERALHLVVAVNALEAMCHVVTAYWPDPALWNADFKTRRSK